MDRGCRHVFSVNASPVTWLRSSSGAAIRRQWLEAYTDAADGDVAVIQQPAEDRLIDIDAFDLVHVHFDRLAADETLLVDYSAIGHFDFGRPAFEPGQNK